MKLSAKEILKPTMILVAICLVMTALLAFTNMATKDTIAAQNAKDAEESRRVALPTAESFEQSAKNEDCYVGKKGSDIAGYVFTTEASSYGGKIQVMTGIDKDGKVTGVILLSTSDTPGLGLNAQKDSFRDQYKQKAPEKGFEVVKGGGAKEGQINAMTGATITSKAVTTAVNEAIEDYQKVKGGE
ncbi:RnfABCDGE type electron transport complex subunit G [Caproiciproducens sp. NJN-50]|uniref:RnfABCDGE type electron transport complex subunit G n=1 Tax=Acutalibacteraceae TaxID=3082771 RepID=UPI000FFE2C25|nr:MULTISPECIES: RnfABCDGE type electron transport complex subunit G [Acutalibacteraceae]QAT50451.1 RnfABCDGE type electron transport complex subunit G [Caproiciproducens sp. NJN-50]